MISPLFPGVPAGAHLMPVTAGRAAFHRRNNFEL